MNQSQSQAGQTQSLGGQTQVLGGQTQVQRSGPRLPGDRWRLQVVHRTRGNNHGPTKRVPDKDDPLHAVPLQSGDPGQDIERTCGQDVGVPVA